MPTLDIHDPHLTTLIDPDSPLEVLADGFRFTEGPVWHPTEHHLTFSDIQGNALYRWSATDGMHLFRPNSYLANGNTYDRDFRLLTCHHGTSRVTRTEADGTLTTLASHYGGKQLNSPNDIVCASDGTITFTDPTYGRGVKHGIPRDPELDFRGLYRLDATTGALTLLAYDFENPNGLCLSLDERRLFVNDSPRLHIRVFEIGEGGTLFGGDVWAETRGEGLGVPDGMKLDEQGNVWCCAQGGIHIFTPDARLLGVLRVPEQAANFCWGEADRHTVFITATDKVYRLRVNVRNGNFP